jgi:hypothetical protein
MTAATFLDVFNPPPGMVGQTAALVAMTASETFLDAALERFTGLRARQRAALGVVQAWLMLDPHETTGRNAVLAPGRPPGLHELQPRPVTRTSLLHAKLALLAFGPSRLGTPAAFRLVVATGNFTEASARHQLELLWTVDVALDGTAAREDRDDVAAAAVFLRRLLTLRYYREESHQPKSERRWTRGFDDLIARAARLAEESDAPTRFFHSLDEALLPQLRERFEQGGGAQRNFLLAGSGFYEQASAGGRKPKVLEVLEMIPRLTASPRRVLLVEPSQAGAVARWAMGGVASGWEMVRPCIDDERRRSLHAKFVYAGHLRGGGVGNGMLYLGSGNLSRRGLMTHGGMASGNIECGVVIDVPERLDADTIARTLFWRDHGASILPEAWRDEGGEEEALFGDLIEASPILSATVEAGAGVTLALHWREDVPPDVAVLIAWTGAPPCIVRPALRTLVIPDGPAPAVLEVTAPDTGRRWIVPVVDEHGRVGWSPATYDRWEDAVDALLDFPLQSVGTSEDEDSEGGRAEPMGGGARDEEAPPHRYALHAAATFIEQVAAHQATLPERLLDEWLDHLERVLTGRFPETMLAAWRTARLDVLEPLRAVALAPPDLSPRQRRRYERILDETAKRWRLT